MSTRDTVVPALTAVGAALGALIGLQLVDLGPWRSSGVVAVGVVLGVLVALGPLTVDRRATTRPRNTVPVRPATQAASPNRTWWTETPARQATVPTGPEHARDGREVDRAVVAQCPRCGDFRLDVTQDADAYAFRCRNPRCGHRWEWHAGAPWPTTVVRRNLTG
ncbi:MULTISPECIES: hypothetical protein [Saccharothrix]|uniref:hypothetical protein n=1 Tax=Saccharothrix TaxID=2071 RepID=UPI00093D45FA|nr:hypothetical protein [Saccharothrix sp. CB00851]OKI29019.1 hypothetical protein A6A25_30140 [Saccharothrix sp. CB00851]